MGGYGYSSNTYLILDKENILIDPGAGEYTEKILEEIETYTTNIDLIINTHCHYDHCSSNYILEEIFGCPTAINDREVKHLKLGDEVTVSYLFGKKLTPPKDIIPLSEIKLDFLEIIETPGHTYGSISIIYKDSLITGDTLFKYGVGRTDFPTGNFNQLKNSILKLEKIFYEKNLKFILPGHGEIGDKRAFIYAKNIL